MSTAGLKRKAAGAVRTVEVRIPSVPGAEKVAMERAAEVAAGMGFSPDRVEDLKTAVSEACMNAIEHGNRFDPETTVDVIMTAGERTLSVDVHDQGPGFGHVPPPDIDRKMAGLERTRGLGIFLIRSLMHEVTFEAKAGGGSVVRMVIHLENTGAPGAGTAGGRGATTGT